MAVLPLCRLVDQSVSDSEHRPVVRSSKNENMGNRIDETISSDRCLTEKRRRRRTTFISSGKGDNRFASSMEIDSISLSRPPIRSYAWSTLELTSFPVTDVSLVLFADAFVSTSVSRRDRAVHGECVCVQQVNTLARSATV